MGVAIDAGDVVNIFSSFCPEIFSKPSIFLNLTTLLSSSVVKFDKLEITY